MTGSIFILPNNPAYNRAITGCIMYVEHWPNNGKKATLPLHTKFPYSSLNFTPLGGGAVEAALTGSAGWRLDGKLTKKN